ncbi:MAG: hypothetical protein LBC02_12810 [Planctomycetaceae bacterium]|jgi:hypothetical protein|nr:hypothetical protein [Planctomycetaceae bacterium]
MTRLILFVIPLMIIVSSGCNGQIDVYGTVSFPDGTPVKKGSVFFQNKEVLAQGEIQPNGSYQLGMTKPHDGVLPGEYTVYISGAVDVELPPPRENKNDPVQDPKVTPLIHQKFMSPQTSGLSCEVVKGMKLPYNITVEYP